VATYREAFTPSRAKDDPSDAELQLELLVKHRDKLQKLSPQSATMRTLDQLVEFRWRLVEDKVRLTNRLTSALKNYFPQVLSWFADKDTTIFCDFLSQWPTLKAVHLARRATLERFFRQHHVQTRMIAEGVSELLISCQRHRPHSSRLMKRPSTRSCIIVVLEKPRVRRTNRVIRVRTLMCVLAIFCVCCVPTACGSGSR
jgi:hypothetical protein